MTRFVGVPGMIRLAQHLAEGLDVRAGVRIQRLQGVGDVWVAIDTEGAAHGPFDVVIVAVPAPQAVPLLAPAPALAEVASGITMAPCWAAMVAFDEPVVAGFDGAFVSGGALSWVARDSSKPGRPDGERWVLHASPGWSRQEWETDLDRIPSLLCSALASHIGPVPAPTFQRAHRWGYARADAAGAPGVMYDAAAGIGACGDWCEGGRIEGALVSGIDLAERIIAGGG